MDSGVWGAGRLKWSCYVITLGLVLTISTAHGAVFTVNSPSDVADANPGNGVCETAPGNGVCTLRAAIHEANALPGADQINLPAGNYVLTIATNLVIADQLTITGAGSWVTIIDGNKSVRTDNGIFAIDVTAGVEISGVTIRNGFTRGSGGAIRNVAGSVILNDVRVSDSDAINGGGGIYQNGTMTLLNSVVTGNDSFLDGGGIINWGAISIINSLVGANWASLDGGGIRNGGTLTLVNSLVGGNLAGYDGGGLLNGFGGTATLINTTLSQNTAFENGAGIFNSGTLSVFNGTITNNRADDNLDGTGTGGGVFNNSGASFQFQNTILAGNGESVSIFGTRIPITGECTGTLASLGNNLMQNFNVTRCTVSGVAPTMAIANLGPLQDNGGPTLTHAPLAGSPAIDAGNATGCRDHLGALLLKDQRGATRHFGTRCDIGAVEFGAGIGYPLDFDGDRKSDIVVNRGGAWLFHNFTTGAQTGGVWTGGGGPGCTPAPMDYNGDGKVKPTQLCGGAWHFYNANGSYNKGIWVGGTAADRPVPADYDGDGKDDVVVYRAGAWLFFDFATGAFNAAKSVWTGGGGGCIPVPMDYNGDGKKDFTQLCGGSWHFYNANGSYNKGIWTGGLPGDRPVPADYEGNGTEQVVLFRGGAWLFYDFSTGLPNAAKSVWTGAPLHWTGGTSLPAPLDYDGDGKIDFTVYSGGPWHFYNTNGSYHKGIWTGGVVNDRPISRRLLP